MDDEIARRRHRIRELEDLELREQEHELRLKEREIESRSRELERDKQRLLMARTYRRGNDVHFFFSRLKQRLKKCVYSCCRFLKIYLSTRREGAPEIQADSSIGRGKS